MLITISGLVGSGKSTTAKEVVRLMKESGLTPRSLRFQSLGLSGVARGTSGGGSAEHARRANEADRRRPLRFKPRRLTAPLAIGYAVRILAFRLSGVGGSTRLDIVDRYFYDNLVYFDLASRRDRLYATVLRRLIPVPDLAILLTAADQTISARRPSYACDYLTVACQRYERLPDLFPNLVRLRTDDGSTTSDQLRSLVRALIERH